MDFAEMDVRGVSLLYRPGTWDFNVLSGVGCDNEYNVKSAAVVVDIGAHIGAFCLPLAKQGAVVHAYEPHPENAQLLRENVARNALSTAHVYEQAVTDATACYLQESDVNTGSHRLADSGRAVEPVTFSEVMRRVGDVDVLKVDCEGCEYHIVDSIIGHASRIKRIVMELHGGEQQRLLEKLKRHYTVTTRGSKAKGHIMVDAVCA